MGRPKKNQQVEQTIEVKTEKPTEIVETVLAEVKAEETVVNEEPFVIEELVTEEISDAIKVEEVEVIINSTEESVEEEVEQPIIEEVKLESVRSTFIRNVRAAAAYELEYKGKTIYDSLTDTREVFAEPDFVRIHNLLYPYNGIILKVK